jgi:hypothetical protein
MAAWLKQKLQGHLFGCRLEFQPIASWLKVPPTSTRATLRSDIECANEVLNRIVGHVGGIDEGLLVRLRAA